MAEAASATGLPFIVSFVVGTDTGRLLDGTQLAEAVLSVRTCPAASPCRSIATSPHHRQRIPGTASRI